MQEWMANNSIYKFFPVNQFKYKQLMKSNTLLGEKGDNFNLEKKKD